MESEEYVLGKVAEVEKGEVSLHSIVEEVVKIARALFFCVISSVHID